MSGGIKENLVCSALQIRLESNLIWFPKFLWQLVNVIELHFDSRELG